MFKTRLIPLILAMLLAGPSGAQPVDEASRDMQLLASLRRATASVDDPRQALEKYDRFLAKTLDAGASVAAREDRRVWQDRLDRRLIRLGQDWLTATQIEEAKQQAIADIDAARQAVAAGRDDASALISQLADRPMTHISGEYLLGIQQLGAGNASAARMRFEAARRLLPTHAPTLTNLALIESSVNRHPRALLLASQAAEAAPGRETIVNNLVEAIHLAEAAGDTSPPLRRARAVLQKVEPPLVEARRANGFVRWGSGWLTADEFAAIEEQRAVVEAEVAELKEQYDDLEKQAVEIDERIARNQVYLRRLEEASIIRDPETGLITRLPLPPSYFEVQRENQTLAAERRTLATEAAALDAEATQKRQSLPSPTFAGELTPVGPEGVPILLPIVPEEQGALSTDSR
jgi:hypothetical protein